LNNQLAIRFPPQYLPLIQYGHSAVVQALSFDPALATWIFQQYSESLRLVFFSVLAPVGLSTILSMLIRNRKIKHMSQPPPPVDA